MNYYENPDLEWYKKISAKNEVSPRCPYASLYKCPIYFHSCVKLKHTGTTELDENEREKLTKFWKDSGLNSPFPEEFPRVRYFSDNKRDYLRNFCPEVIYSRFGYFASYLSEFAHEIDRDMQYSDLKKHNIKKGSWAWNWSELITKHYTDCRLYSILLNEKKNRSSKNNNITPKRNNDYKNYEYKCYDHLHIPGTSSNYRSNKITINGNEIKIGDSLFLLLLRLISELKKKEGGWANKYTLYEERIITNPENHQIYSNLRSALQGSLLNNDAKEFIENDGSMNYRVSTHPDFITYNKEKLLCHNDTYIRKFAEQLP